MLSHLRWQRVFSGSTPWGTLVVAVLLIATVMALWFGSQHLTESARDLAASEAWRARIEGIVADTKSAESATRGLLLIDDYALLRQSVRFQEQARAGVMQLLAVAEAGSQRQAALELDRLVAERFRTLEEIHRKYEELGFEEARRVLVAIHNNGDNASVKIIEHAQGMLQREARRFEERSQASESSAQRMRWAALTGMGLSLTLVLLLGRASRLELRARSRVVREMESVNNELKVSVRALDNERQAMRWLARFAGLLQGCATVEEACEVANHCLGHVLENTSGTLYLLGAETGQGFPLSSWGEQPSSLEALMPESCWALRQGRSFASSPGELRCAHLPSGPLATTCVPLRAQGQDLGVIVVRHGPQWDRVDLAEAAAEQLALALANLRLRETLRTQSLRDALTGLPNRRELEQLLPREVARAQRNKIPLAVLALDIDYFKRFNDTYGHEAGDAVLQAVAKTLEVNVRAEDLVARLGGEEFVVVMPGLDAKLAREQADRLRRKVMQIQMEHRGQPLGTVSTSVGVAVLGEHTQEGAHLIDLADRALYRAKANGRNCVEVGPDAPPPVACPPCP